jgi:hypothetical protein
MVVILEREPDPLNAHIPQSSRQDAVVRDAWIEQAGYLPSRYFSHSHSMVLGGLELMS